VNRERVLKQYKDNADLFRQVRADNKYSLREIEMEIGVDKCKVQRFEKGADISAIDFTALMMWMNLHRRCY